MGSVEDDMMNIPERSMRQTWNHPFGHRWTWSVALMIFLMGSGLLIGDAGAAERTQPFRIGALTPSWGPPPQVVGLRDGLLKLGYHENEDFVIGVRFTQGDLTALTTAAGELVQYGVDLGCRKV